MTSPGAEWFSIGTFAIITTDANELVADIHDRMPVILAPDDSTRWLGCTSQMPCRAKGGQRSGSALLISTKRL
jgi:putative SOS response-associated peptidase YedK